MAGNRVRRAGTPVQVGKLATRERLILEGERLFGDRGLDGVTMRMICEAAGQKYAGSVQYHFNDILGLLQAIFEYRESQLQPYRQQLLDAAYASNRLSDIKYLLRVIFEPNFRMYHVDGNLNYIKCHAAYLATYRPRGVPHPVDGDSPSTAAFRQAIALLRHRLSVLGGELFDLRLESVGAMFLSGLMRFAARPQRPDWSAGRFFEDMLEMMAQAISVLPCPAEPPAYDRA